MLNGMFAVVFSVSCASISRLLLSYTSIAIVPAAHTAACGESVERVSLSLTLPLSHFLALSLSLSLALSLSISRDPAWITAGNSTLLTSPQKGSKSPVPIALICTASRRVPASANTHQGPGKGNLIPL